MHITPKGPVNAGHTSAAAAAEAAYKAACEQFDARKKSSWPQFVLERVWGESSEPPTEVAIEAEAQKLIEAMTSFEEAISDICGYSSRITAAVIVRYFGWGYVLDAGILDDLREMAELEVRLDKQLGSHELTKLYHRYIEERTD